MGGVLLVAHPNGPIMINLKHPLQPIAAPVLLLVVKIVKPLPPPNHRLVILANSPSTRMRKMTMKRSGIMCHRWGVEEKWTMTVQTLRLSLILELDGKEETKGGPPPRVPNQGHASPKGDLPGNIKPNLVNDSAQDRISTMIILYHAGAFKMGMCMNTPHEMASPGTQGIERLPCSPSRLKITVMGEVLTRLGPPSNLDR
jgi:hypothetical protein